MTDSTLNKQVALNEQELARAESATPTGGTNMTIVNDTIPDAFTPHRPAWAADGDLGMTGPALPYPEGTPVLSWYSGESLSPTEIATSEIIRDDVLSDGHVIEGATTLTFWAAGNDAIRFTTADQAREAAMHLLAASDDFSRMQHEAEGRRVVEVHWPYIPALGSLAYVGEQREMAGDESACLYAITADFVAEHGHRFTEMEPGQSFEFSIGEDFPADHFTYVGLFRVERFYYRGPVMFAELVEEKVEVPA